MMDLPQPPADQELKNIIDKLAQFVARNGPEFEHMTKQKQKDNPKFSFLFGGTYFHYYQYRVTTEQAILKQKQRSLEQQAIVQQAINRQSIQTAPWQQHMHQMQDTSQEQIRQSEQNLAAQHQLLLQQQQVQVDEIIRKSQEEKMTKLAQENELDLKELDGVLQPIIDSCTKDSISTGKGWIFSHATTPAHSEVIILYILKKVTEPGATFEAKLHLVYLINDVLHHCIRKNADELKKVLERAVVPIFCSTSIGVEADKQQKLSKLHKLWETNKYFEPSILDQLQNPASSLAAYQAGLIAEYASLITPITTAIQAQYSLLQKQHQDFVTHLTGQMHQMQMPVPYAFQSPQNTVVPAQPAIATPAYIHPPRAPFEQASLPPTSPVHDPRLQQHSQSPQNTVVPAQPAIATSAYIHPPRGPFEQASLPTTSPAHDPRLQQHPQVPEDVPKPASEYPPVKLETPDVEQKDPEPDIEPEVPCKDEIEPDIKIDLHPPEPEPSPSSSGMGHEYPPSDMCDPGYGHPDMPLRHPNGRPIGPPNYMDDYSPHYGHGPPPYGGEPPEYMTPPHMGSYGRRMPYRDEPPLGTKDPDLGPLDEPSSALPQSYRKSERTSYCGHHDIPPEYMEPALPPCSPPYYDLPAGLMVPLVRLEDTDYEKPLEPDDVHLPAPALPTERLLAAVEQFYCPPTHERTRNNSYVISSEGWEQLGLYEFFKAKAQARKQKGIPDDRDFNLSNEMAGYTDKKDEKRRVYREFKSPEPEVSVPVRNGSKGNNKRHSRSLSRSRSRSRSPEPSPRRSSRSPSPTPRPHFNRSRRRSRSRSPMEKRRSPDRDRDRDRERDRDASPPYLGSGGSNSHDRRLDESNKGHQLLRKMGWGGAGLGAAEQGIQDPVDAGDVRDRQDMYKGIGSNLNDPYENFRKSKGQAFINRMKARAEELGKI